MEKDLFKDILEQFEKIQKEYDLDLSDINPDDVNKILKDSMSELNDEMYEESTKFDLNIQKINDDAVLPQYAYPKDSGFDLYSTEEVHLIPFARALVPTGLKIKIPEHCELQIRPKSGLAINKGLTVLNTPGTVDNGYTGEIKVILFNTNNYAVTVEKGTKIAQGVLCPVFYGEFVNIIEVEDVENGDRGDNGFGSTGLK
jgi:dUTP pyrophosphatase